MFGKNILLFVSLLFSLSALRAQVDRPNIVIIISDDHSYQTISAYGSKVGNTPNIDRIAQEGALFTRAYVNNSICGPSRATLLTGKYSHKNGFKDNETSVFDFSQNLFVKDLQETGYSTAWVGKIHLGHDLQGFDYYDILNDQGHYFNPEFISASGRKIEHGYVSDLVTDKALAWLKDREQAEPFCLILGHKATHRTWMPDPSDFGVYDEADIPLPLSFYDDYTGRAAAQAQEMSIDKDMRMGYDLKMFEDWEQMMKDSNFRRMDNKQKEQYWAYYNPIYDSLQAADLKGRELAEWKYRRYMVDYLNTAHSMDRNIGRVLDYLAESDLEENTIVIYLSDQGFYMGEHGWFDKRFMYEESFRTPLIMRFPKLIPAGANVDAQIMNVDIAPTLLDLTGIPIRRDIQGTSFLPVLTDPHKEHREALYYHYFENGEHAVSPHFGVKLGRYKLIRFYKRVESWELFDLETDPQEMNNVYSEPSYKKIVKKMKSKLQKEIKRFDDREAAEIMKQKIL